MTGLTLCSAFLSGMAGQVLSEETVTPSLNPGLEPPPVAAGKSRLSQVFWYFQNGTCGAQAIIATYGDLYDISRETALRMACGFSGGIGLTGEVCSLVVGATVLLGMKNGPRTVKQRDTYEDTVEIAKCFVKDFKMKHNTVVCREIIQYDISTPEAYAKAHELDKFQPCIGCTKTVVDLLENKYDIFNRKRGNS